MPTSATTLPAGMREVDVAQHRLAGLVREPHVLERDARPHPAQRHRARAGRRPRGARVEQLEDALRARDALLDRVVRLDQPLERLVEQATRRRGRRGSSPWRPRVRDDARAAVPDDAARSRSAASTSVIGSERTRLLRMKRRKMLLVLLVEAPRLVVLLPNALTTRLPCTFSCSMRVEARRRLLLAAAVLAQLLREHAQRQRRPPGRPASRSAPAPSPCRTRPRPGR